MPQGSTKSPLIRRRPRLFAAITNCRGVRLRIFTIAIFERIFGSQLELPQLGPLGTHGHANVHANVCGFESPIASFEVDQAYWGYFIFNYVKIHLVVVTVAAQTWKASIFSQMRPQVVAWHGKSVLDCSVVPTKCTYRPPYVHRNSASEFVGHLRWSVMKARAKASGLAVPAMRPVSACS
ncbi:hypothetical protein EDB89DRAFT_1976868 [Lactarius sanguifluus]|nr:hypothetical protein EDB89DRAFT_1976868 [Lactarius sanguifluus]